MKSPSELVDIDPSKGSDRGNHLSNLAMTGETDRSMRVLNRIAAALDIPVETFFADGDRRIPADEASAQDVAELTRAFLAITDPVMRRYCLDVVRAAGAEVVLKSA